MHSYGSHAAALLSAILVAFFLLLGVSPGSHAAPLSDPTVLTESIREKWDDGYAITDFVYGDGQWAAVMTKDTGYGNQSWLHSTGFPGEFISEKWDEGLRLTTLTHGDREWVVVMTENIDWPQKYWRGTADEVLDFIEENWDEDYDVSEAAYGDGEWVVVMSEMDPDISQSYHIGPEWPEEFISRHWDDGYDITDFAYGDGEWLVVMGDHTGYSGQSWRTRVHWPADEMQQDYDENPDGSVLKLAYGDGLWAYTYAVNEWSGAQSVITELVPAPSPIPTSAPTSTPTLIPTPIPTPAATESSSLSPIEGRMAEVRQATPNLVEDFASDSGDWEVFYEGDVAGFLRRGAYHLTVDAEEVVGWGDSELAAGDFYLEVDVTHMDGPLDNEAGLLFRYVDDGNFYFYAVSNDGFYALRMLIDNEWQSLIEWTESGVIETGEGSSNRLGILVEGDQISLAVNDVLLAKVEDGTLSGDQIFLAAGALAEAGVHIAFDNLSLWKLDEEATPDPTPTAGLGADVLEEAAARVADIKAGEPSDRYSFTRHEQWDIESTRDVVRYFADDAIHMRTIADGLLGTISVDQDLADFYLEVDTIFMDGPQDTEFGLIFRSVDNDNYYLYVINPRDRYSLLKRVDGQWQFVTEWTSSNALETADNAITRLGILAEGDRVALFANDIFLTEVEDDTFDRGGMAVAVGTFGEGNAAASFDNLEIWELGQASQQR